MTSRYRKHLNVLLPIFVVIIIMLGLVSYSPELYRVFCGATGYGGTTQRAYTDPATRSARTVNVAFDSNVAPDLPWRFEPEQRSVTVHLGDPRDEVLAGGQVHRLRSAGRLRIDHVRRTRGVHRGLLLAIPQSQHISAKTLKSMLIRQPVAGTTFWLETAAPPTWRCRAAVGIGGTSPHG